MITVTSLITDSTLIPESVNLQRLEASGAATVLGVLHDDGLNGDAVANDKTFTLQVTLTEPVVGPISFRVSASFRGLLARLFSTLFTVTVTGTGPAPVAPKVVILAPPNLSYLNLSPTTVNGTVDDPTASVTINSIAAPVANACWRSLGVCPRNIFSWPHETDLMHNVMSKSYRPYLPDQEFLLPPSLRDLAPGKPSGLLCQRCGR